MSGGFKSKPGGGSLSGTFGTLLTHRDLSGFPD
jgi:hypothetical protein